MSKNIKIENAVFSKQQANEMFVKNGLSIKDISPLKHKKTGKNFDDVDYCILCCEALDDMEESNPSKYIPANYGVAPEFIKLCRDVKKAYDEGTPKSELFRYLDSVITNKF